MLEYKINCTVDINKISSLRESVGWNKMYNSFKESLDKFYCYICCFDGDELIGFIDIVSNGITDAYLQDLVVKPSYQGKGIGKTLINMAIEKIKSDGIYMIGVIFDKKLLGFYKKFGFFPLMAGLLETRKEE
jgi:ribosomal protein S18 acetylase RimI-like enzyme